MRDRVVERFVRQAKRFPEVDLAPIDVSGLEARDAALARAIDHAVARHWLSLVAILQSRLDREWDRVQPELKAPLLAAVAQVIYLERIPAHAAVNHAVGWVRQRVNAKAAGFANAVLRALVTLCEGAAKNDRRASSSGPDDFLDRNELPLPDGGVLSFSEPLFDAAYAPRLAQQTGHVPILIERWSARFGSAEARRIALHGLVQPPTIVSATPNEVAAASDLLSQHDQAGFALFTGSHGALLEWLAGGSARRVQDPASADAVALTAALKPNLIADVCAGMGTKTHQLAAMHPQARIIASDIDQRRLEILRERFKGNDRVIVAERATLLEFAGMADLLVLDVPCSNTGVLARRVEARFRFDDARLAVLTAMQRQIIADSIPLLAPHGLLLYSTCSLEPEENEEIVAWMGKWHRLRERGKRASLPAGLPGDPPQQYHDGTFAALLVSEGR